MNLHSASGRPVSPRRPTSTTRPTDPPRTAPTPTTVLFQRDVLWNIHHRLCPSRLASASLNVQRAAAADAVSWAGACKHTQEAMEVLLTQIGWSLTLARLADEVRRSGQPTQATLTACMRLLKTVESAPDRFTDRPGTANTAHMVDALLHTALAGWQAGHVAATAALLLPLVTSPSPAAPGGATADRASTWLAANALVIAQRLLNANTARFDGFVQVLLPLLGDLPPQVQAVCLLDIAFLYSGHPRRAIDPATQCSILATASLQINRLAKGFDPHLRDEYQRAMNLEATLEQLPTTQARARLQAFARPRPRWSVIETVELIVLCNRPVAPATTPESTPAVACLLRTMVTSEARTTHTYLRYLLEALPAATVTAAVDTLDAGPLVRIGNALMIDIWSVAEAGRTDLTQGRGQLLFHCAQRADVASPARQTWIKHLLLHLDRHDPDRDVLKALLQSSMGD